MFPKPTKSKRKYSQRIADKYFSLLIRHRGHCEAAGKDSVNCGGSLQCAHIVTRTNKRLRYDELNALCLCAGHHRYYTTHASEWFWQFIPDHFNKQFYYIKRYRDDYVKNNNNRLKEIIDALDIQLQALGVAH